MNLEGQRKRMSRKKNQKQEEKNEFNGNEKLNGMEAVDIGAKRGRAIKAGYIGIGIHLARML